MLDTLLSWSLFALTQEDEAAIHFLCRQSLLSPMSDEDVARLLEQLRRGEAVGLSVRDSNTQVYYGLCVLSREDPSPEPGRSLSMSAFTFAPYSTRPGRSPRITDATRESLKREVDRFCRTHGYTRVHCYANMLTLPLDEIPNLDLDFESTIKTPRGDFYSLSSDLPTPYTGDPYDGANLLQWLAARFRMFDVQSLDSRVDGQVNLATLNPHLRGTAAGGRAFPISIILDSQENDSPVQIYFGPGLADKSTALSLTLAELREITQSDRLSLEYWPPPPGATSIAVEIRRNYFEAFKTSGLNAFFDSGVYGVLLQRSIAAGENPLVFFVDFETSRSNPEVIGFGTITAVESGDPQVLWGKYGHMSSWSDMESFARYRSIKRYMTAILFKDFRQVSQVGAGLPVINHSWAYVPGPQAYRVARGL